MRDELLHVERNNPSDAMKAPEFRRRRLQMDLSTTKQGKKTKKRRPPQPVEHLLPQPTQEPPTAEEVQERLKAERVQIRLAAMPSWTQVLGGRAIHRVHAFPQPQVAAWYAGYLTQHAAAARVPATVSLAGRQVSVTLHGPATRRSKSELNDDVLDFAVQLG